MPPLLRRCLLPMLLFGAVAARVGYGLARPPQESGVSNADGYAHLAASFAESWSLNQDDGRPSAYREPAYPIYLGLFFKAFGFNHHAALLANGLAALLALLLLHRIGLELFSEKVGFAAAAIASFYPPFVFYAAQTLRETFQLAMTGLALWTLLRARRRGLKAFALAGLANALAALTNTVFVPFTLVLAPAAFFFILEGGVVRALKCAAVYLTAFLLLYSAWPVRNYLALDRFIVGSTLGAGAIFYNYLIVPQEVGGTPREGEIRESDPIVQAARGVAPEALDRYYWKAGLERVREAPGAFAKLVAWRFFRDFWRILPRPRAYAHSYRSIKWVSLLSDAWIIPLGFVGMALARLRRPELLWFYLFIFSINGIYAQILTMLRYRLSVMPWVILFACVAAEELRGRLRPGLRLHNR